MREPVDKNKFPGAHFFFTDSGTLAYPYPGRSTNVIISLIKKKLINCVRPGVALVRARRLRFTKVLIREDLPTLERPMKAISGNLLEGYWEGFTALLINSADWINMAGYRTPNTRSMHPFG